MLQTDGREAEGKKVANTFNGASDAENTDKMPQSETNRFLSQTPNIKLEKGGLSGKGVAPRPRKK